MDVMGKHIQASVDGKLVSVFCYRGAYEVADSAIRDIRIASCMRDFSLYSLGVRLESGRLPWESDNELIYFFLHPSADNDSDYKIMFFLKTALGYQRDAVSAIAESLLQNTPYSLADIQPYCDFELLCPESEHHTWSITLSCTLGNKTFTDALHTRRLLSQAFFLSSKIITTPYAARQMLQLGHPEVFVGYHESEWLEVKSAPYEFKSSGDQAWKLELAKDVAQFANSRAGGLLVIGLRTRKRDGIDTIERVTPFPYSEKRTQSYRDALKSRIHPPVVALDLDVVRDGNLCLLYAYIPPQPEENKPYLVTGSTMDGEFESLGITIARRQGDASTPVTAQELHSMIVTGRAFLRGQQVENNPIGELPLHGQEGFRHQLTCWRNP